MKELALEKEDEELEIKEDKSKGGTYYERRRR
jgi:hypothetical protein